MNNNYVHVPCQTCNDTGRCCEEYEYCFCDEGKKLAGTYVAPVVTSTNGEFIPPIGGYITTDTLFSLIDKWNFYELRQYQNEKRFQWVAKANSGCYPWGKGDTPNEAMKDLYIKLIQNDEKIAKLRADRTQVSKAN